MLKSQGSKREAFQCSSQLSVRPHRRTPGVHQGWGPATPGMETTAFCGCNEYVRSDTPWFESCDPTLPNGRPRPGEQNKTENKTYQILVVAPGMALFPTFPDGFLFKFLLPLRKRWIITQCTATTQHTRGIYRCFLFLKHWKSLKPVSPRALAQF